MSTSYQLSNYLFIDEQSNKFSLSINVEGISADFPIGGETKLHKLKDFIIDSPNHENLSFPIGQVFLRIFKDDGENIFFILSKDLWTISIPITIDFDDLVENITQICDYWPINA